jgi:hypothetical protein
VRQKAAQLVFVPFYGDAPNARSEQFRRYLHWVRDLGVGLIMIGGEDSFGVGGYYQTPVEDALPAFGGLFGPTLRRAAQIAQRQHRPQ